MKFPGRVYEGEKATYLAVYNHSPDICVATPPSLRGMSKRVAHVAYSEGGRRSGIDLFEVNIRPDELVIPELDLTNQISRTRPPQELEQTRNKQDVRVELVRGTLQEPIDFVLEDIAAYCKSPAKNPQGARQILAESIIPKTEAKWVKYSDRGILTPGKPEFVSVCGLEANIDFSKGCVAGWIPQEGATFDSHTFKNFFLDPFSECDYCYASPKHKTFPKTIFHLDRDRLKAELLGDACLEYGSDKKYGKRIKVLRFGKRTEAASQLTRQPLIHTLEACLETGTKTVLPTKFLKFNRTVADLLRRTDSVVLYSIGNDEDEPGACAYGCDNEWRLSQAISYKVAAVNTALYLLMNPHAPPQKRDIKVLDKAKSLGMSVQLLPERFTSKCRMKKVTGFEWDFLKEHPHHQLRENKNKIVQQTEALYDFEGQEYMGSYYVASGVAIPQAIHSSWTKIIGNNKGRIRMCHHNKKTVWCGSCFLKPGLIGKMEHKERKPLPKGFRKKADKPTLPFPK